MEFKAIKIRDNFWTIDQGGVRTFLLIGPDKAILFDTGFGGDIRAVCETISDKPITLVTTHSDGDHTGCDRQFDEQYIHADEMERYLKRLDKPGLKPLQDGDKIAVGEFELEVLHIPGHTPGSIALLDRKHKFILSGDTVQNSCIYMHGEGRDLPRFRDSIEKLDKMRLEGAFDTAYACHGDISVPADILTDILALAEEVLGGGAVPAGPAPERFPETVKVYRHGRAQMYYEVK